VGLVRFSQGRSVTQLLVLILRFALSSYLPLQISIIYPLRLPLRLLPRQKPIENRNILFQALEPLLQLRLHFCVIIAQFLVKVLAVRRRAHRGAENRLHDERVVRLECVAVGIAERVGELFVRVRNVVAQRLCGEVKGAAKNRQRVVTERVESGGGKRTGSARRDLRWRRVSSP
jgi:hypothetical protein